MQIRMDVSNLRSQVAAEYAAFGKILAGIDELMALNPGASIETPKAAPKVRVAKRTKAVGVATERAGKSYKRTPETIEKLKASLRKVNDEKRAKKAAAAAATTGGAPVEVPTIITDNPTPMSTTKVDEAFGNEPTQEATPAATPQGAAA